MRGIIDKGRRRGKGTGRFLILGSASIDLLRQSGESLAGRIAYIDMLVDLLLVRRLRPFHANVRKRLVKSPKVYVRDSGLLHALLDIEDFNQLSGHPVVGVSWEGFVIENLLSVIDDMTLTSFYRTSAGAEVDLVLEFPGLSEIWAIEIKRSLSAKPKKGFYNACEDIQPHKSFVVYAGDERYPISVGVEAIGLSEMSQILIQGSR